MVFAAVKVPVPKHAEVRAELIQTRPAFVQPPIRLYQARFPPPAESSLLRHLISTSTLTFTGDDRRQEIAQSVDNNTVVLVPCRIET